MWRPRLLREGLWGVKVSIYPVGPFPETKPLNGLQQVVNAQLRHLPGLGWTISSSHRDADVTVSHAGSAGGRPVTVAHCHGLYPTGEQPFPREYHEVNRRVIADLRCAKAAIVPSQWVADLLRRDMHLEPYVVPHGLERDAWPERALEPLPPSPVVVWNKNRATDVCDPTPVNALAERAPWATFWTTFGRRAPNVQVLGLQPHRAMRDLLYRAHVYLATTRETFGIGTLEAMAAGLPVVGYRWGATAELVPPEVGILVPPGDVQGLADALAEVCATWADRSLAARQAALAYSWASSVQQMDAIYREAVRPHAGPKVSVVIPCYNYERYVQRAVRSVAMQTFQDLECTIVDDGSTDGSLQAVRSLLQEMGDPRFRVVTGPNRGVAAARNRGAYLCRGEYLCFLDADDALAPTFLETCIRALDADPCLGLAYTGLLLVTERGERPSPWPPEFHFAEQMARRNQVPTCNVMRRAAFLRAGGYRQRFHPAEDADLWLRMGSLGVRMAKVSPEPLFRYTLHSQSASAAVRAGRAVEPDWTHDHPWTRGHGHTPFAAVHPPEAHPVVHYDPPTVSVVIPVGPGHEETVLRALDSVEAQTTHRWECLIVDDTPDQRLALPGRPWAKVLRTGGTRGPAHGRNLGVRHSRGAFLVFLDADDFLEPTFLEETLAAWQPRTYVYTDRLDEAGKPWASQDFDEALLRNKALHTVTFLHPREAYDAVGGMDEGLDGWEDWDYTIAIAAAGYEGVRLPRPLVTYCTDAGHRRDESYQKRSHLRKALQEKWKEVPMGCCGSRRRATPAARTPAQGPVPANPLPARLVQAGKEVAKEVAMDGWVRVRYVGGRLGAALIRCPSGNRYRYGGNRTEFLVPPEDAAFLASHADFVVEGSVSPLHAAVGPTPEGAPQTARTEALPVVPLDVQPATPAEAPSAQQAVPPSAVEAAPSPEPEEREGRLLEVYARHALSTSQLRRLYEHGIYTLEDVLDTPKGELLSIRGIGGTTVDRLYALAEGREQVPTRYVDKWGKHTWEEPL